MENVDNRVPHFTPTAEGGGYCMRDPVQIIIINNNNNNRAKKLNNKNNNRLDRSNMRFLVPQA